MKTWEIVDDALDVLSARTPGLAELSRNDIVGILGCTPDYASQLLQQHRTAQRAGRTRWVLGARDYGRAAVWLVLAAPGASAGTARRRRLTMGHADHIAADAARRVISDLTGELDPALAYHPAIQAYLTAAGANMEAQMRLVVNSVRNAVTLVEAAVGEIADRTGVKSV